MYLLCGLSDLRRCCQIYLAGWWFSFKRYLAQEAELNGAVFTNRPNLIVSIKFKCVFEIDRQWRLTKERGRSVRSRINVLFIVVN